MYALSFFRMRLHISTIVGALGFEYDGSITGLFFSSILLKHEALSDRTKELISLLLHEEKK